MLPPYSNKAKKQTKIGDCEVGNHTDIQVFLEYGNIWMCAECIERESKLSQKSRDAQKLVEESRTIDSSITTQAAIYNVKTVSAIELRGAIENDETIPADQKEYAFTKECLIRRNHLQKVIFDDRQALAEKENEMAMWQTEGQSSAAKLRADIREEFKAFDIHYKPISPKTIKSVTTGKTPKKSGKLEAAEAREAAKKYNLDAPAIQMIAKARNISAEEAAKFLQKQLS